MATKPNETYKWGENATHEQVAAYEDTGWPSDIIPPKRTQFNWYQNLVGKWLGWAEDAVDELVGTVLERWFVELPANVALWPNKSGIYQGEGLYWAFMVEDVFALTIQLSGSSGITISQRLWTGTEWGAPASFTRSNLRSNILQESETNYVTPKGLVDYFRVDDTLYPSVLVVPHQAGVYAVWASTVQAGVSVVVGDVQIFMPAVAASDNTVLRWDGTDWIEQ